MKKNILQIAIPAMLVSFIGSMFLLQYQETKRDQYEKLILEKSSNYKDLQTESREGLKSPNQPDMAALQEYMMTVDPALGFVPKKRLWEAYHYTNQLVKEQKGSRDYGPTVEWEGTDANMGGRTRAIMFDPNDPDNKKVWAGGVTGGLWYTNDITDTEDRWTPVDDFWSNLNISCLTYDPNETETFYIGTGEAQTARIIYRESSGLGAGIFKSTDAGETWELIPSTSGFQYITDIAVRNEEGESVIYAAVASGTYKGEDHVSTPTNGLFRSNDGGDTWEQVLPSIFQFTDIPFTPADIEIASNGRIFVGTMENLDGVGGATVLFSDSGDPDSWTVYDHYNTVIKNESYYNIPARTIVASAPSDPNIVYAQFAAGYVNGFTYYRGRYMAKSTDGGLSWTQIPKPDNAWSTLAWHAFILKVDPLNPNAVITGGLDLWKSTNGGGYWRHISDWSLMYFGGGNDYVHADQHNILYRPGTPTSAIFSSDGGVFYTETAILNYPIFKERNQGYNSLQFYTCAINPLAGSVDYIGGLQDNGTLHYQGSPLDINDMIDGGDGAFCFWDRNEPDVYVTSVYYNQYKTFYKNSPFAQLNDRTGTFISPGDYNFKEDIIYSNGVDFYGYPANHILRVTDVPFLTGSSDKLVDAGTDTDVWFSAVTYSQYSPLGTSTLFLGTVSGKLYKVTNAESEPYAEEIGSTDFPIGNISCVAIGESEDVLLVTFSNYGVSSIWFTLDSGQTWEEKESNLPDMPVRWAIFHPSNNEQAMLATETGVWTTNSLFEQNTDWTPAMDGMGNIRVDMLKIRDADKVVLAASHGRGLFTCDYEIDMWWTGQDEFQFPDTLFTMYPNPTTDHLTIGADLETGQVVKLSDMDVNGKTVLTENISRSKGIFEKKLDLSDLKKGIYVVNIHLNGSVQSRKLVVQ